jgi:hypothetical protein
MLEHAVNGDTGQRRYKINTFVFGLFAETDQVDCGSDLCALNLSW